MPNYRLDPATFENPTIYKTLPLIMARLEEMEKKDRSYISKFLIRFNRICKNISEIKDYQFKENVIDSFREEYRGRCKRLYEHYEAYFVEHLENFIVTKLKRLKEAGKIKIEFREDENWNLHNYFLKWLAPENRDDRIVLQHEEFDKFMDRVLERNSDALKEHIRQQKEKE